MNTSSVSLSAAPSRPSYPNSMISVVAKGVILGNVSSAICMSRGRRKRYISGRGGARRVVDVIVGIDALAAKLVRLLMNDVSE